MGRTPLTNGDLAHDRNVRLLVVEPDASRRQYLTGRLQAVIGPCAVTSVSTAAEARRALEGNAQGSAAREPWFVLCGLPPRSWSTLVLLEWIRGRATRQRIETALLTDTSAELLPIAIVDYKLRMMAPRPAIDDIETWIGVNVARDSGAMPPHSQMTTIRG